MTDISYQLYSSREFQPLNGTLTMLAELGYTQVEGFAGVYADPGALADILSANGLTMASGHFSLEMLENESARVLEIASAAGMKAVYCPHIGPDDRPDTAAGWRAFGARVQAAGESVRNAGLIYGWHNHDFEFVQQADGSIPMEEMFAGGPELSWEADLAWVVRGGADPIEWIERHGHRISSVHIKDIAPTGECVDEDGWADVGTGTMDWAGLLGALPQTPSPLLVMEHDKPSDHRRFARRSIASVRTYLGE